jgi:solute:Na+ symporter, SSS family
MDDWGVGITLIILVCALLIYSFKYSSSENIEAYSVANRNVGIFALTATLVMTEFNMATLISFSSLGYISGLKALALPGIFLIGLTFYAVIVAKKWKEFNGFSVVDFFISRYGRKVGYITSIFLFTTMAGFSATYLKSLTFLFENIFPQVSYWIISAYIVLIMLFMVVRKGLISIIRVDVVAFIIVLIVLPLVLYQTSLVEPSENISSFNADLLQNNFILSLIPLTMFSYILAPWYGQRIFAAKNTRVAFISVILSAIFVFLLYAIGVLISYVLASKGIDLSDPQQSFPYALDLSLKNHLYPLGYIIFFLISSTTLTGVWNAMANITLEFMPSVKIRNKNILMTLICAVITYILSNSLVDNILNKMILANIPVVALSFALLAGFYWPKVSIAGVYASIIVGLLSGIIPYIYLGEEGGYTYYWAFIGIPLIFISGAVVSLLYPPIKSGLQAAH